MYRLTNNFEGRGLKHYVCELFPQQYIIKVNQFFERIKAHLYSGFPVASKVATMWIVAQLVWWVTRFLIHTIGSPFKNVQTMRSGLGFILKYVFISVILQNQIPINMFFFITGWNISLNHGKKLNFKSKQHFWSFLTSRLGKITDYIVFFF